MIKQLMRHLFWTLPFICFCAGYLTLSNLYHIEEIEAPALIGCTTEQALALLAQHNLNARLMHFKEDDLLPDGTIISQMPPNGQKIKPNQSIYIVVSKKPQKVKTPSCIGKALHEIEPTLTLHKIHAKKYYITSIYPQSSCFAQHPNPDQELQDNKIILYLSKGNTKPVIIPNLVKKPLDSVIEFLTRHSMQPEISHYPQEGPDHTCVTCSVVDQRPMAGSIMTLNPEKPLPIKLQVHA